MPKIFPKSFINDVRLGSKYASEKTETFKMKLWLAKLSRLLQRTAFLVFPCLLSFTIMADDQDVILVQFFEELPILVEQATRNSHSSNINLLENFHINDSLNPFTSVADII